MHCGTCGERGKEGLSLLEPENASLLQFIISHLQLAGGSFFVCHACVVEIQHWRNFLTRFQTSQTHFQQVLANSDSPQQTTDVSLETILPKCQVLVTKLLQCDSCSFYTNNKTQLESHMQTHLEATNKPVMRSCATNKKFRTSYDHQCSQCNIQFVYPEMISWHTKNCHGADTVVKMIRINRRHQYQCVLCQSMFTNQNFIIWHLHRRHEFYHLPFQCRYCDNRQFVHISHLQQHLLKCKNGDKDLVRDKKCTECGIRFSHAQLLTWHIAFCHGSDNIVKVVRVASRHEFQCNFCKSVFKKHEKVVQHLNWEHKTSNLPYQCKRCGKQFTHFAGLKKHQSILNKCVNKIVQMEQNSVKCKLCSKGFTSGLNMKNHILKYHAIRKERKKVCVSLKCRYCNVTFSSYVRLFSHCRDKHPGKNVIQCDICKVEFRSYDSCMRHRQYKHSGLVFACNICPATFSHPKFLRQHLNMVHSQLNVSCEFCGVKFKCKATLNSHVKDVHLGPLLHCANCNYKTRSKTCLSLHLKCHHQDKQLSCKFCSAKFRCQEYLNRHVRIVHTAPIMRCEHCLVSTRSKSSLIRHLRRIHFLR